VIFTVRSVRTNVHRIVTLFVALIVALMYQVLEYLLLLYIITAIFSVVNSQNE